MPIDTKSFWIGSAVGAGAMGVICGSIALLVSGPKPASTVPVVAAPAAPAAAPGAIAAPVQVSPEILKKVLEIQAAVDEEARIQAEAKVEFKAEKAKAAKEKIKAELAKADTK